MGYSVILPALIACGEVCNYAVFSRAWLSSVLLKRAHCFQGDENLLSATQKYSNPPILTLPRASHLEPVRPLRGKRARRYDRIAKLSHKDLRGNFQPSVRYFGGLSLQNFFALPNGCFESP